MSDEKPSNRLQSISEIKAIFAEKLGKFQGKPLTRGGSLRNNLAQVSSRMSSFRSTTTESMIASQSLEKITRLLSKPDKNEKESLLLYDYFRKYKFFIRFKEAHEDLDERNAFSHVLRSASYEVYDPGTVIYQEGDVSEGKIYLIMTGEVSVIKRHLKDPSNPPTQRYESPRQLKLDIVHEDSEAGDTPKTTFMTNIAKPLNSLESTPVAGGMKFLSFGASLANHLSNLETELETKTPQKGSKVPKLTKFSSFKMPFQSLNSSPDSSPTSKLRSKKNFTITPDNSPPRRMLRLPDDYTWKRNTIFPEDASILAKAKEFGEIIDKKKAESYFGHKCLYNEEKRAETILTNTRTEVAILYKDSFKLLQEKFSKKRLEIQQFIQKIFPSFDTVRSTSVLRTIVQLFADLEYSQHQHVTIEGDTGNHFYILMEGTCELVKEIVFDDADKIKEPLATFKAFYGLKKITKKELRICQLEKGSFIGEEILFSDSNTYMHTVKVISSKANILRISKKKFKSHFPTEVINGLEKLYLHKKKNNTDIFNILLKSKKLHFDEKTLDKVGSVLVTNKDRLNYNPAIHPKGQEEAAMKIDAPLYTKDPASNSQQPSTQPTAQKPPPKEKDIKKSPRPTILRPSSALHSPKGANLNELIDSVHSRVMSPTPTPSEVMLSPSSSQKNLLIEQTPPKKTHRRQISSPILSSPISISSEVLTSYRGTSNLNSYRSSYQERPSTANNFSTPKKEKQKSETVESKISLRIENSPTVLNFDKFMQVMREKFDFVDECYKEDLAREKGRIKFNLNVDDPNVQKMMRVQSNKKAYIKNKKKYENPVKRPLSALALRKYNSLERSESTGDLKENLKIADIIKLNSPLSCMNTPRLSSAVESPIAIVKSPESRPISGREIKTPATRESSMGEIRSNSASTRPGTSVPKSEKMISMTTKTPQVRTKNLLVGKKETKNTAGLMINTTGSSTGILVTKHRKSSSYGSIPRKIGGFSSVSILKLKPNEEKLRRTRDIWYFGSIGIKK